MFKIITSFRIVVIINYIVCNTYTFSPSPPPPLSLSLSLSLSFSPSLFVVFFTLFKTFWTFINKFLVMNSAKIFVVITLTPTPPFSRPRVYNTDPGLSTHYDACDYVTESWFHERKRKIAQTWESSLAPGTRPEWFWSTCKS